MRSLIFKITFLFLLFFSTIITAQINPQNIEIIRDKWGVPHIFAPTDAEVAYGLAWATCEDDFKTLQLTVLAARGRLGEAVGRNGALLDVVTFLIGARELVDSTYQEKISDKYKSILEAYAQGVNDYAAKHPKEALLKDFFPITVQDMMVANVLAVSLLTGVQNHLGLIFDGKITKYESDLPIPTGSNGIAISRRKTTNGNVFLDINSHQPLEGIYSWYEAHLCSEEGLNILGGTFTGGTNIFHGVNEYLAWAHTVNYPDFVDVYKLTIHPEEELAYKFDGEWLSLEEREFKFKVKTKLMKVGVKRTFYWSKYGPTIKTDHGFYALRFGANTDIRLAEQWYWMNKAQNFEEFQKALQMHASPGLNLIYADKADNIYHLSNGFLPYRNPNYNWENVLPGDTSATLWEFDFHPLEDLPQILNPKSGYVYNTNHSPFISTAPEDNLNPADFDPNMDYLKLNNNRSLRFQELIQEYEQLTYEDFKRIKFDRQYPGEVYYYNMTNLEDIFNLSPDVYPEIADLLTILNDWDRNTDVDSERATIFIMTWRFLQEQLVEQNKKFDRGNELSEEEMVSALRKTKAYLEKYFGSVQVVWGELQRHTRGAINLPMAGGPDVIAAMSSKAFGKNGQLRTHQGESYICLVQFPEEGLPIIETINAYGTSTHEDSPHYTDQMEMFVNQQLKPMTLDKEQVRAEAVEVYHPE